jgi:hypothetical protein
MGRRQPAHGLPVLDDSRGDRGLVWIGFRWRFEVIDPGRSTAPIDDEGREQATPLMQDIAREVPERL